MAQESFKYKDAYGLKDSGVEEKMAVAEKWVNYFQPNDKKFKQMGQFRANLANGVALMHVALAVDPDTAKAFFKQKDIRKPSTIKWNVIARLGNFNKFCKEYNPNIHQFDAKYILLDDDGKTHPDLKSVVTTLENLSSAIDKKGGEQPQLIGKKGSV
eukprot:224456_1